MNFSLVEIIQNQSKRSVNFYATILIKTKGTTCISQILKLFQTKL